MYMEQDIALLEKGDTNNPKIVNEKEYFTYQEGDKKQRNGVLNQVSVIGNRHKSISIGTKLV